jgi:hypothetical protein
VSERRNGLIMAAVAGALVLAAGGVGVYLLSGTDTGDPATAARQFVDVYQRGLNSAGRDVDVADFEAVVCESDMPQLREVFSAKENPVEGAPQFRLSVKNVNTDGDKGSFTVATEISVPGSDKQRTDDTFNLVKNTNGWRVCGLSTL